MTSIDVISLAIDPLNPNILYAGTFSGGALKSPDAGATWSPINTGLTNNKVNALMVDPRDSMIVYAGTDGGGVFKSIDGGSNWTPFNAGLTNTYIGALVVSTSHPDFLYTGTYGGGVFALQQPGPAAILTLFAPHGGETIPAGSNYTITWGGPPEAVKFRLSYSKDNGVTWIPFHQGYVSGTSYEWTVPIPRENKPLCLVKVVGYDQNNIRVGADKSYAPITIEVVKLTSLDGWESFPSGSNQIITWQIQGTKNTVNKVKLSYTKNGGSTWYPITTLTGDARTFKWAVPAVPNLKTKCKVKVELKDAEGVTLGSDASDSYFMIQPAATP
jgi:hypothetical protein